MNKSLIIKAISVLMAVMLCMSAFGCVRHVKDDPKPTKDPNATAEATAPAGTEQTADSSEPAESAYPAETETVPDDTEGPGETPGADNTPAPGTTREPEKTDAPSDRTQAPSATAAPTQQGGATSAPTQKPTQSPTQKPTPSPVPAATATPRPTATPKPDPITSLAWIEPGGTYYCDMNFDGKDEKIELTAKDKDSTHKSVTVKVTVGGSNKVLLDTFDTASFLHGLINNFNSGDNRVEIVVSTYEGERDQTTRAYRLNDSSSGLLKCSVPGFIESVSGNSIKLHRYLDILGTWECTALFGFGYDSFTLSKMDEKWMVIPESNRWCTVSEAFIAGIYTGGTENQVMWINPGTKLYPTATDFESTLDFVTDTGTNAYISIEIDRNGRAMFEGGYSFDTCFSDLTYIP